MNGAAFAALGEMAVDLMLGAAPFVAISDGVKLGDSTFNLFFRLTEGEYQWESHMLGLKT